jgi:hypothetical protein
VTRSLARSSARVSAAATNQTEVDRHSDCKVHAAYLLEPIRFGVGLLELVLGLAIDDKNHAWAEHVPGERSGKRSETVIGSWSSCNRR